MDLFTLSAFTIAYAIAVLVPGPGVAAVVARALGGGFKGAFPMVLGILAGEDLTDSRIELEAMHSHSFVAVAARTHPLAAAAEDLDSLEAVVLAEHVQIVLSDPTQITEGRDFGVLSPTTWRVNNQETKYAMIRAGHGWGRLPHWVVEKNLASGELVRLPVAALGPGGQIDVQFYLARRIDRPLGPVARAFRDAILANHASGI